MPAAHSEGAGCYDVYAAPDAVVKLSPGQRTAISTGLKVEVPYGYILSVRPRSGLAIKEGLTLVNSPGTIDSDYRGEVKILVINLGDAEIKISPGDRIAQFLLEKTWPIEWQETLESDIENTKRGEDGFGSTGKS